MASYQPLMVATKEKVMSFSDLQVPVTEAELASRSHAPRVTVEHVHGVIKAEHYFTAAKGAGLPPREIDGVQQRDPDPLDTYTFCVLTLENGYVVTGESACADPANFSADVGQRLARVNAVNKIWALLGYQLRDRLHKAAVTREMLKAGY